MADLPSTARVVIIGGGVMGCGLAYHLAHLGWTDVVLLEKAELTSGSTWHAAGQITHSTSSYGLGKCVGYNIDLYSKVLEAETGHVSAMARIIRSWPLSGIRLPTEATTRSAPLAKPRQWEPSAGWNTLSSTPLRST